MYGIFEFYPGPCYEPDFDEQDEVDENCSEAAFGGTFVAEDGEILCERTAA